MARVTNPDYQNETGLYFIREVGKNISLEHRLPLRALLRIPMSYD